MKKIKIKDTDREIEKDIERDRERRADNTYQYVTAMNKAYEGMRLRDKEMETVSEIQIITHLPRSSPQIITPRVPIQK